MKIRNNIKRGTLFIILILLLSAYIIFPDKIQGQVITIPKLTLESLEASSMPEFPMYSAAKVAQVLMEATKLSSPSFKKEDKVVYVKIRSYCLNRNRMANGQHPHSGALAADSSWRLGTRVQLWYGGTYLGLYTVKDRGDRNIVGNNFDLWARTCQSSRQIGVRKMVAKVVYIPHRDVVYWPKKMRK